MGGRLGAAARRGRPPRWHTVYMAMRGGSNPCHEPRPGLLAGLPIRAVIEPLAGLLISAVIEPLACLLISAVIEPLARLLIRCDRAPSCADRRSKEELKYTTVIRLGVFW